jgi:hypothetical protein
MSSPDDNERSDDFPNSDYAPKWTRDRYRQGSPDTAKDEPPPSFLRRSLDPEIVHLYKSGRRIVCSDETQGVVIPTEDIAKTCVT